MMDFSFEEIISSVLYALIYGAGFSIFYMLISLFFVMIRAFRQVFVEIISFDKILPSPTVKIDNTESGGGGFFAFLSVVLFFVGFLFLSYFTLDGVIRFYMLVLSSASVYILYSAFYGFLRKVIVMIFNHILFLFSTIVRLVIFPVKHIFYIINNKFMRN